MGGASQCDGLSYPDEGSDFDSISMRMILFGNTTAGD
jgi:hypothetical protein